MIPVVVLLIKALRLLQLVIMIRVMSTWFVPDGRHPAVAWLRKVTDPILKPFKVVIPMGSGLLLDVGPVLCLLALQLVEQILVRLATGVIAPMF